MLNNQRNIIIGDSNVGKSTFLYQLCNNLRLCGYSVCLIDGDGAGIFYPELDNEIIHLLNKNDVRLFKMINEIEEIDIIFIDDINFLSSECFSEVSKSKKIIISTKSSIKNFNSIDINDYIEKCELFKLNKTTIEYNNSIIERNEYLLQSKREIKLKSLLNEE